SVVYDSKNNVIGEIKGSENRVWVSDKEVPKYLKDAFVAIEDERFYDHPGVDFKRVFGAVINLFNPKGKTYGGSTITQQVIKNLTGKDQFSLKRKVQEQWEAIQLEKRLEKWQILELYMNVIYMGGRNYYGVQQASKAYYGKDVKDLDLAECASLAGITNLPGRYAPVSTEGRKHNKDRQMLVLKKMLDLGKISRDEYDKAIAEELKFTDSEQVSKQGSSQSYYVDKVIMDVKKDLMNKSGMSEQLALQTIYSGGLKIYTSMDSDVQKAMDAVYKDDKYFPIVNKKAGHPQSGMAILDTTGHIVALYGGYGQKNADMILNRATQIERQPGSSFKPIAVYGPAVNERIITAATVYDNAPAHLLGDNKPAYPRNYETGSFKGLTTIRDAIRDSVNVVAAKVWLDLGAQKSLEYLKKDGIPRDNEGHLSIAMGGLNKGVCPLDMAGAYVPFVNKGVYVEPSSYTKVLDKEGNVLLEKKQKTTKVYDETAAFIMESMMRDVCRLGTAAGEADGIKFGLLQDGEMDTAGKTGTTSDMKDKWFVGYTPYYVAATWYGYDKPTTLQGEEYNQALKIWYAVMRKVHENKKPLKFQVPDGVIQKDICIYSGKLIGPLCDKDPRGNANRPGEYFIDGTEPSDSCDTHVTAKVCQESKDSFGRNLLAGPNCPPSSIVDKVLVHRKVPYTPISPEDSYPNDWLYEAPEGNYCNVHGGSAPPVTSPGAVSASPGPSPEPTAEPKGGILQHFPFR
ncbi:MAG TPA: PBP1A family penicillin-binding protein, partial [Clostridia bacterium]